MLRWGQGERDDTVRRRVGEASGGLHVDEEDDADDAGAVIDGRLVGGEDDRTFHHGDRGCFALGHDRRVERDEHVDHGTRGWGEAVARADADRAHAGRDGAVEA